MPFTTPGLTSATLTLLASAALAVDVPYSDNFNSYANGATPANFGESNDAEWFISTDGNEGVYRSVLSVTSGEKSSSSGIVISNAQTGNYTVSTKVKVNSVIGNAFKKADVTFRIPEGIELAYFVSDPTFQGRISFNPGDVNRIYSSSGVGCADGCTLTVHSALVDDTLFLTGTLRSESSSASVTRRVPSWSRSSNASFFDYIEHIFSGQVNRSAVMDMSYDDFSIVFETFPPKLGNISTRLVTGPDDKVAIAGFIVKGNQPKSVLVRAVGGERIHGYVTNPTLELHGFNGRLIAFNDNWTETQEADIQATGLAPQRGLDAALIADLDERGYTVVVRGADGETGRVIAEVFDITNGIGPTLVNLSTRGHVGVGDDVMIAGVIPQGDLKSRVAIRALGPSLEAAGVTGPLMDPILELRDFNGAIVTTNDNWRDTQPDPIEAAGLAPTDDRESALIADLLPANYTALVRGKSDTTGIALVEVYHLN